MLFFEKLLAWGLLFFSSFSSFFNSFFFLFYFFIFFLKNERDVCDGNYYEEVIDMLFP